jgi:hypothetical protein
MPPSTTASDAGQSAVNGDKTIVHLPQHDESESKHSLTNSAAALSPVNGHRPYRSSTDSSARPVPLPRGQRFHHGENAATGTLVAATPLFERLVTEEVQEIKSYIRIIESQNRKIAEMEQVHWDLEHRLQLETQEKQQLETLLEIREREWSHRLLELRKERDEWKQAVKEEQTKNATLIEHLRRKDLDIHRMLQRKVRDVSCNTGHV